MKKPKSAEEIERDADRFDWIIEIVGVLAFLGAVALLMWAFRQ